MLDKEITRKIITVGPDYHFPSGGIAKLLQTYSFFFETYNFIPSVTIHFSKTKSKIRKIYDLIKSIYLFIRLLLLSPISIVHIHTASGITFYRESLFVLIAKLMRKKVFLHIHSGSLIDFYNAHPHYNRFILNRATTIITIAAVWEKFLREKGYANIITIPNPVDPPIPVQRQENKKVQLLFLGQLCENKGIYDLLKMIREYYPRLKDRIELKVGGNGEVSKFKKIVQQYNLTGIVEYVGWLTAPEKARFLTNSDIYIQPSYKEALGIAIIEAMSYKKPVIASNTGGIPELVHEGENGFLITPGNIDQMYEAVNKLLNNKNLAQEMGICGYAISQNYSLQTTECKLKNLYTQHI